MKASYCNAPFDYPDGYDGDKPKNMTFSIGVGYRF